MTLVLAIDFDGTIADTDYPKIHGLKDNAKEKINALYAEGHTIIIHSCRVNQPAEMMKAFLDEQGILYHYINENAPDRIQTYGSDTRKISADLYIDDHNIGCTDINWLVIYDEVQIYLNRLESLQEIPTSTQNDQAEV